MNSKMNFDEDLLEEFLDEKISVSSVYVSKSLNNNMDANPLRRIKSEELDPCSPQLVPSLVDETKEKCCEGSLMNCEAARLSLKINDEPEEPRKSKLQKDIKDLLRQAIKFRSTLQSAPTKCKSLEDPEIGRLSNEILVTMKDIFGAE